MKHIPVFHLGCLVLPFVVAPILAGCDQPNPGPESQRTATEPSATATAIEDGLPSTAASPDVALVLGDSTHFQRELKQSIGKVVLVDFWATWCSPCVAQLPHTVKLHQEFHEQGLSVMSVSMDEPESQPTVLELLQSNKASFFNLLTPYGASEEFAKQFELRGDIPFYKLYDRSGKLRYSFSNTPDGIPNCEPVEKIDARVAELLSETSN